MFGLLVALPVCTVRAQTVESDDDRRNAIRAFVEQYSEQQNRHVGDLSIDDLDGLYAGQAIVEILDSSDASHDADEGEMGVFGLKIVPAPRLLVWLALIADSEELDGRFTRAVLSEGRAGTIVRYQHIDLPWPIKDRHWVIRCENNLDIADSSAGLIWERRWSLHEHGQALIDSAYAGGNIVGVTRRVLDNSIYLPANSGTWTLLDLGSDGTLVAAYLDAKLGGRISDGLVRRFTRRQLRAGLASLQELSMSVLAKYDGERFVHDGRGLPISQEDALRAGLRWRDRRPSIDPSIRSSAD